MSTSVLDFDAFIIDLDGVVTDTGALHARAWKTVFDEFMRGQANCRKPAPFHLTKDYTQHVHGRTQAEAIRAVLASREIEVPEGSLDGSAGPSMVQDLARAKSEHFRNLVEQCGVRVFAGSRQFLDRLQALSRPTALVTNSRNGGLVVERAGLGGCFDVIVDGLTLERERLDQQPAETGLHFAVTWLGKEPAWTAVIEATERGVAAGRHGGFGCVVGVLRGNSRAALRAAGADLVVEDLAELL